MKKGVIQFGAALVLTAVSIVLSRWWLARAAVGEGLDAFSAATRFLETKLKCPQPARIAGPFVVGKSGWKPKASNVWEIWGSIEITNKEFRWTASLRSTDAARNWIIQSLAIDGHAVDRSGKMYFVAEGVQRQLFILASYEPKMN